MCAMRRAQATIDSGITGMTDANFDDKRLSIRQAVLKAAQITFDQSVVDCLVLDISETGARVRTAAVVPVPEQVTLRLRGGAIFSAVRCWSRGMEIGLSLETAAALGEESARVAWRVYEMIRATTLAEPQRILGGHGYFDDMALRAAAEDAEAGLRRLEAVLATRARAPRG
jgi:PilZ domain-containing protein